MIAGTACWSHQGYMRKRKDPCQILSCFTILFCTLFLGSAGVVRDRQPVETEESSHELFQANGT